ncbi:hypothetical protein [Rhodopirellula sp. MGV]|uniref:hypothetical protein n=1 Tax=Rhodopirellula sp. MGV TaxID=2023130 RepID=UPI001304187F|nr:hypothetical protein [Rhodopirellula sp. MGV]
MKDRPGFRIELQADSPDDRRTIRELRHIIKALLRGYHFRCLAIRALENTTEENKT